MKCGLLVGRNVPKGQHPDKRLTALRIRTEKRPGRYADGGGLYLVVDPSGAKRWMLRTIVHGRRRDIGLGSVRLVSLAQARDTALELRKVARSGGDPLQGRRAHSSVPTFTEAAERVHASHRAGWRNAKHAAQWLTTLKTYAMPEIGSLKVDQVGTPEVLRVLTPIWLDKPETARRVRQRVGTVLDWAKAAGYRSGDNPIEGADKGLPKQSRQKSHHSALPYHQMPEFMKRMRESRLSVSRLALEFLILTASRTGEVIGAKWTEFDTAREIWTVPAERMKAKRAHRVPLGERCRVILAEAKSIAGESEFVFAGMRASRALSQQAMLELLKGLKPGITVHGFRSSFRDWAAEETSYPREIAEMALAHTIESKVEAAYRRGDLLERRRTMMEDWAVFLSVAR